MDATNRCERCGMPRSNPKHTEKCASRAVIRKYARPLPSGHPMRCTPSLIEQHVDAARKQGQRTDNKPIYDTREAADNAARELEALGYDPLRPVPCRRSRHDHYHLTRDNDRRREGK